MSVEDDSCDDGSTHQCCNTVDRQSTLKAGQTCYKVANQCKNGAAEGCGRHQNAVVAGEE